MSTETTNKNIQQETHHHSHSHHHSSRHHHGSHHHHKKTSSRDSAEFERRHLLNSPKRRRILSRIAFILLSLIALAVIAAVYWAYYIDK